MNFLAIIPARYASTRFPGKPLARLGGKPVIQTRGLDDFGLPELGFFDPERPANELLDLLYAMSCLQITERQLYRNMALVPLDEKTEVICKQDGNILLFIGA